jgi:hypothetical protein
MSDSETDSDLGESLQRIRHHVEQVSHMSKHMYAKAVQVHQRVEHPDIDIWAESFRLHERAYVWAKQHMVARKCSLWQIHQTLLESAKKDGRILPGKMVKLTTEEAAILDLSPDQPHQAWTVLGRLPRFFL